ncbi:class I SAM-dependent DNA methyltransferase [Teichococcus oryzae]|uniref:Methyltransferase domain-containing protein n=1 Tax=Teichococcus oryzae TaxID=1608942 RepID=A0A5B2TC30_9PROT|nr:SAM-dependent methyltransferase [Pseudoroseomonas oryzae]KAA2211625.1 methyltransferase domain-containing protein [Pseudoroseomonas oryzae]
MNRATHSLPASYFDALYATDPDPWNFRTSEYEAAKYRATLDALPRPHYGSVLEIGCSIGVLTRMLAPRCGRLLALDGASRAIAEARRHCAGQEQVDLQQREIPRQWPRGRFDLILFSEVLYYLDQEDLVRTAALALRSLRPEGEVLLVHWTGTSDYPLSGDAAVESFMAAAGPALVTLVQDRTDRYRLDLLRLR